LGKISENLALSMSLSQPRKSWFLQNMLPFQAGNGQKLGMFFWENNFFFHSRQN